VADATVHHLRLPRIVTGLVGRSRNVERVAVWDDVPVALPACAPADAPIAFVAHSHRSTCRYRDGRLYHPLGDHGGPPEAAWTRHAAGWAKPMAEMIGEPPRKPEATSGSTFPWFDGLRDVSRRRGIGPSHGIRFREIVDTGEARRDAAALALAGRLLVVGRELWYRVGLPRYQVRIGSGLTVHMDAKRLDHREDPDWGRPWDAGSFRIDRRADAVAYAEALSTETRGFDRYAWYDQPRIREPGLLAECYDRLGDADVTAMRGIAASVAEAVRPRLGEMPLAEVSRWVSLQTLAAAGDVQGMRDWMEAAGATRKAMEASGAVRSLPYREPEPLDLLDAAIVRYEAVERPRMHLDRDGDEAAILAL
jgi:hypothetical protein